MESIRRRAWPLAADSAMAVLRVAVRTTPVACLGCRHRG